MNKAAFHSAGVLDIDLFIGKFREQDFVFTAASVDFDIQSFTWQLVFKKHLGDRVNALSMTLGNGLSFPIYTDNRLRARFESSLTASLEEGQYYWFLIRTDTDEVWLNGKANLKFGVLDSSGSSQTATVNIENQTISVELSAIVQVPGGGGSVSQTITQGVTTSAPSENAVFDALALKAPLASPTFTGTPAAPTAATGTNTTQLATTAFVRAQIGVYVDWSASLSVVGFSSFTNLRAYYKDDGVQIHIWVAISGTSNATSFTLQLPVVPNSAYGAAGILIPVYVVNNSGAAATGRVVASGGSATLTMEPLISGGSWTAANVKSTIFHLTYQK